MNKITIGKEFEGKVFFTSDTHFDHFRICLYCDRPFSSASEMNKVLVNNWNSVVSENDIVFHLGDFAFAQKSKWKKFCDKLNGKKYLILGNHDKDDQVYHEGFESVDDIVQLSIWDEELDKYATLILCHYCMTSWPGQWNSAVHIFGHSHTNPRTNRQTDYDYIANRPLPSYDVGVDNNNFTPISYDELKIIITKQLLYGRDYETYNK